MFFWISIFVLSLAAMVKGADWFLTSAERIGLAIGLSPFVIGVTIVGLGTSFPELISSLVAVSQNITEIVPANAVGSNIANILLIVGSAVLVGKRLTMTKSLIELDLPLLAAATLLAAGVLWDGTVTFGEAIILIVTFLIYMAYTILHRGEFEDEIDLLPSRTERRKHIIDLQHRKDVRKTPKQKLAATDFIMLTLGVVALLIGANYLVDSVIQLSQLFAVGVGVISLAAVSIGTSMPELTVSIRAALKRKSEVALGNIFGSNVFNLLVVIGIPALIRPLTVDAQTLTLGLPVLLAATFIFIISGIPNRLYMWEGAVYLTLYAFFIGKLFGLL